MQVVLIHPETAICAAWEKSFDGVHSENVTIAVGSIFDFPGDVLAAPGNSFGYMDGGLDALIAAELDGVENAVQERLRSDWRGECPVGAASTVETADQRWPHLIYAPTMRLPEFVHETRNAYLSFRAILLHGLRLDAGSIVCPSLCTGIGGMTAERSAIQMRLAYDEISRGPRTPSVADVHAVERGLFYSE